MGSFSCRVMSRRLSRIFSASCLLPAARHDIKATWALVFVIVTRLASGLGGKRFARFDAHLLGGFVAAHPRALRIAWPLIDLQHVFPVGDKRRAGVGRN